MLKNPLKSIRNVFVSHDELTQFRHAGRNATAAAVANMALDVVKSGGVWTVGELADLLVGPDWRNDTKGRKLSDYIGIYLITAWKRGDVARAEIHQRPDQGRPSIVRYAANWKDL